MDTSAPIREKRTSKYHAFKMTDTRVMESNELSTCSNEDTMSTLAYGAVGIVSDWSTQSSAIRTLEQNYFRKSLAEEVRDTQKGETRREAKEMV